jgi:hypothetical protein
MARPIPNVASELVGPSELLMFDRASDNTHRQTLRRGTRCPARQRYQFVPTQNPGGWAFRLPRDLCQPSTLQGHNATPHVQAWFARLREFAEGGVKVVRLDPKRRALSARVPMSETSKVNDMKILMILTSQDRLGDTGKRRASGSRSSQRHTHFLATPAKPSAAMGQDPDTATSPPRLPGLPTGHDRGGVAATAAR